MGLFSWNTSDTDESIPCVGSSRSTFTVYMKTEDGRVWVEDAYEGYGVFGGKDIFTLIAELNGLQGKNEDDLRSKAIDLVHDDNDGGDFNNAAERGIKLPKLFRRKDSKFEDYDYPTCCEYQGYFYDGDWDW